jgi:hypothetical protein
MEQKHLDMTQFGCRWLDLQHEKIPHHELNGLIPFLLSTLLDLTEFLLKSREKRNQLSVN